MANDGINADRQRRELAVGHVDWHLRLGGVAGVGPP